MALSEIYEQRFDEDVQTESSANQCPECDGRVSTNTRETTCEDCGLVIEEHQIDHGPEWRGFDKDERRRTGSPITVARHDRGLTTKIGRGTDANGNELSGRKRRQLVRLRREQSRGQFQSTADRNLAHGLGEVRRIASALGLSTAVRDQACQLLRSAQHEDLLRGRSIEAMAAASVYGACRCNRLSRLQTEITAVSRVADSRVTSAYQTLNTELGLPAKPMTPIQYIPCLAADLDCPDELRQQAHQFAEQAGTAGVTSGVHPAGFAAACLYKASLEAEQSLTQAAVADAAGASIATVRSHWKTLEEKVA